VKKKLIYILNSKYTKLIVAIFIAIIAARINENWDSPDSTMKKLSIFSSFMGLISLVLLGKLVKDQNKLNRILIIFSMIIILTAIIQTLILNFIGFREAFFSPLTFLALLPNLVLYMLSQIIPGLLENLFPVEIFSIFIFTLIYEVFLWLISIRKIICKPNVKILLFYSFCLQSGLFISYYFIGFSALYAT